MRHGPSRQVGSEKQDCRPSLFRVSSRAMGAEPEKESEAGLNAGFTTTHWSRVLAAGESKSSHGAAALAELCRTYWYPLYVYVRRLGHAPEDARDLTQEFFARLLEKGFLGTADPEKGRFRSFLMNRFSTTSRRFGSSEVLRSKICLIRPFPSAAMGASWPSPASPIRMYSSWM